MKWIDGKYLNLDNLNHDSLQPRPFRMKINWINLPIKDFIAELAPLEEKYLPEWNTSIHFTCEIFINCNLSSVTIEQILVFFFAFYVIEFPDPSVIENSSKPLKIEQEKFDPTFGSSMNTEDRIVIMKNARRIIAFYILARYTQKYQGELWKENNHDPYLPCIFNFKSAAILVKAAIDQKIFKIQENTEKAIDKLENFEFVLTGEMDLFPELKI